MRKTDDKPIRPYSVNPRKITDEQLADLQSWLREFGDLSGVVHDVNSNEIVGGNQRSKAIDINQCEIIIEHRLQKPDEQGTVALGYIIWEGKRYSYRQVKWTPEQCRKANIIANKAGGALDWDILNSEFDSNLLDQLGLNDNFVKELEESLAGIMTATASSRAEGSQQTAELKPMKMVRVLISFPMDKAIEVADLIEKIQAVQGVEVDYGAN